MAITITPTGKTGMDVGLGDIAVILSEQNQVLAETAIAQQKLTSSFDSYLKMLAGDKMDELQDERRAKSEASTKSPSGRMSNMLGSVSSAGSGMLDYLKTFAKRLLPVALGLLFGDDLIKAATGALKKYLGIEISRDVEQMIMAATGGALLGFLFGGIKGGLFGLVLGAFTSEPVRKKISETFNKLLGTELNENDWQTWGTGIIGALGFLWGPKLIGKAFTTFFSGGAGTKVKTAFAANLVKDIFKSEAFLKALRFGMRGFLIGAIAFLAIQGGKALVDYFRGKNKEMFDKAISESDQVIDEYQRTGDIEVLKRGEEKIGKAQTEAARMVEIGRASGSYDEASAQYEKTTEALGTARGEVGRAQEKVATMQGVRGNVGLAINKAYDLALAKYGDNVTADNFRTTLQDMMMQASVDAGKTEGEEKERLNTIRDAIRDNLDEMVDYQVQRRKEALARPAMNREAVDLMSRYGNRSTGNVIAPIDNSQMSQVTNNSSSPIVLPSGGATDYNDNRSKFFISGL